MGKVKVVIKRNAGYEKGMFGLSLHDQPGGAANVEPINSEPELRERLLRLGLTEDRANDLISRLQKKTDYVDFLVEP